MFPVFSTRARSLLVLLLPGLALHVYDPGDVVHALGHGRPVLLRAVVHVQQPGQREYVRARYANRRQFRELLVPRVRRDGGAERVESRADRVYPRPFAGVGLDPPGPGHVLAVPGGRGGGRGARVVPGSGTSGGTGDGNGGGTGGRAAALVRNRRTAAQLGGLSVGRGRQVHRPSGRRCVRSPLGQVQRLRFGRRRRFPAPLRQRQYPVHVPYVVEQPQTYVRRRLVAAPRPERRAGRHVHRQHGLGHRGGRDRRVGPVRLGRAPVSVVRVVVRPSPLVRPPVVPVAVVATTGHRRRRHRCRRHRHVHARVLALIRGRRVRFPLDRGPGHRVRAARRR